MMNIHIIKTTVSRYTVETPETIILQTSFSEISFFVAVKYLYKAILFN